MGRLIDADELKDYFKKLTCSEGADATYRAGVNDAICNLLPKIVDSRPTVDAAPVIHAHWTNKNDENIYVCSNCGHYCREFLLKQSGNIPIQGFCTECGAIMNEEEDNHEIN